MAEEKDLKEILDQNTANRLKIVIDLIQKDLERFKEITKESTIIPSHLVEVNKVIVNYLNDFKENIKGTTETIGIIRDTTSKIISTLNSTIEGGKSGLDNIIKSLQAYSDELSTILKADELSKTLKETSEKVKNESIGSFIEFSKLLKGIFDELYEYLYQVRKGVTYIETLTGTKYGTELVTYPKMIPYASPEEYTKWMIEIVKESPKLFRDVGDKAGFANLEIANFREALSRFTLDADESNKIIVQTASALTTLRTIGFYEEFRKELNNQLVLYREASRIAREYNLNQLELVKTLTDASIKFKDISRSGNEMNYIMALTEEVAKKFNLTGEQTQDLFNKLSKGLSELSLTSYAGLSYLVTGALPTGIAQTGNEVTKLFIQAAREILNMVPNEFIFQTAAIQQIGRQFLGVSFNTIQASELAEALRKGGLDIDNVARKIEDLKKDSFMKLSEDIKEGNKILSDLTKPTNEIANILRSELLPLVKSFYDVLPLFATINMVTPFIKSPAISTLSTIATFTAIQLVRKLETSGG
jgi:hypothetical protein